VLKNSILAISALALVQTTSAHAIQTNETCLPREDFESMLVATLPTVVKNLQDKCEVLLPADSALLTTDISDGSPIKMASAAAWPMAAGAIQKMIDNEMTNGADIKVLQIFSDLMISAMVKQEVKTENCQDIEDIYSPIAVLPPQNIAALASALIVLGATDDKQSKKPPRGTVCF